MRPASTDALLQGSPPRPRKLSDPRCSPPSAEVRDHSHSPPVMFFLADEAQVQAATGNASFVTSASASSAGSFGVKSLDKLEPSVIDKGREKAEHEDGRESGEGGDDRVGRDDGRDEEDDDGGDLDTLDGQSIASSIANHDAYLSSNPSPKLGLSQPMTPVLGPSPLQPGTPHNVAETRPSPEELIIAAPQLIMPQITMPSRRPFTERGKRIGRLKIMIAGDSGIGKTSLIKSIVQTCEDIVHVDPVSRPANGSGSRIVSGPYLGRRSVDSESTTQITDVYASTRPYPSWWGDVDDSRVLRRKSRSGGEEQVIERNLCFVDTPGYGSGTSFLECIEPVVRYVEMQFEKTHATISGGEGDLMSLLSGSGTSHIDIVFYVILHRLKPVDIEFIKKLQPYTSVLPVIAKSDTLTPQQIMNLKLSILSDLRSAGIRPFLFGKSTSDILRRGALGESLPPVPPFAISSLVSPDSENMDASALMSPDYIPPLVDTELKHLVDSVFDVDNIAWLKHVTAKRFIAWRAALSSTSLTTRQPSTPMRVSMSALSSSALIQHNAASSTPADSFALARVADHTQREERLARVRLSRWAHDLQKSLQSERERYERLARGERAVWLTERLHECVADGQLVPISTLHEREHKARGAKCGDPVDARDPFGLLKINEAVAKKLLAMIKIAGFGGLVGVVGVWAYKQWGAQVMQELS